MGSWGIRAHESDYGLDLLAVAEDRYLRGVEFKTFHVKHITELLRSHIIDKFAKGIDWRESEYIDHFYDYTFPYRFAHVVILVAECFAEYRLKGKYVLTDFSTDKPKKRKITEFIFTSEDLGDLQKELQAILDPEHSLYESWEKSDSFNKWQAHLQTLCGILSQAISEGGDDNA